MAKIIKAADRNFVPMKGRPGDFALATDNTRELLGIEPRNLNFDVRSLEPDKFSSAYHFHRYGEEFFMILSGSATLRTPDGLHILEAGDIAFFGCGEESAHQLYNHTAEECTYLDVRAFTGQDVCEYPDTDKVLLVPSFEIFDRNATRGYYDGEEDVREVWKKIGK